MQTGNRRRIDRSRMDQANGRHWKRVAADCQSFTSCMRYKRTRGKNVDFSGSFTVHRARRGFDRRRPRAQLGRRDACRKRQAGEREPKRGIVDRLPASSPRGALGCSFSENGRVGSQRLAPATFAQLPLVVCFCRRPAATPSVFCAFERREACKSRWGREV